MALIVFIVIALAVGAAFLWTLEKMIFQGKWTYAIFFLAGFLPFYITSLSVVYLATQSPAVVGVFQILKELVVLVALLVFILYHRKIAEYPFRLHSTDWFFLAFLSLAFLYLLLPIGQASFLNKALYFKSMLIPGFVYFLGRNTSFSDLEIHRVFKIIFFVALGAFLVNLVENFILNAHLQQFTGYALYNFAINDIEPSGNFGLTWTFETQAVTKRLASFFSDPLEMASSVLMGFAAGLIWFLTSKKRLQLALPSGDGLFTGKFGILGFKSSIWSFLRHDFLYRPGLSPIQTDRSGLFGLVDIWDLCGFFRIRGFLFFRGGYAYF